MVEREILKGRRIRLAGADANRVVEIDDEDLAVADLSGFCRAGDGFDGLVDLVGIDGDLDLDLGQETHGVFGAAIDFGMALLPPISLDFGYRETVNADGGQGVADFFQLEWLDDRHNNFHGSYPRLGPVLDATGRSRLRFTTRSSHHGHSQRRYNQMPCQS